MEHKLKILMKTLFFTGSIGLAIWASFLDAPIAILLILIIAQLSLGFYKQIGRFSFDTRTRLVIVGLSIAGLFGLLVFEYQFSWFVSLFWSVCIYVFYLASSRLSEKKNIASFVILQVIMCGLVFWASQIFFDPTRFPRFEGLMYGVLFLATSLFILWVSRIPTLYPDSPRERYDRFVSIFTWRF
jgi:hypothetical protein